jgi:prepilin-type processing-associated H-X9-DG protein
LVVIAIIAILAAILFPVFAKARARALTTDCISNLKQMGTALTMYASDYDDVMPPSWSGDPPVGDPRGWETNIMVYATTRDLFRCPETKYRHSYVRNEFLGEARQTDRGEPSKCIQIGCLPVYPTTSSTRGGTNFNNYNLSLQQSDDRDRSNDGQYRPYYTAQQMINNTSFVTAGAPFWIRFPGAHNGFTPLLFMDGHVAAFHAWDPDKMTFQWGRRSEPLVRRM